MCGARQWQLGTATCAAMGVWGLDRLPEGDEATDMLSPYSVRSMRRGESTHRRGALRLPGAKAVDPIKLLGGEKHGQAEDTRLRRLGSGSSMGHSLVD
jgi:hypothetical protein